MLTKESFNADQIPDNIILSLEPDDFAFIDEDHTRFSKEQMEQIIENMRELANENFVENLTKSISLALASNDHAG